MHTCTAPTRRWFSFGLRTMFLVVTVSTILAAVAALKLRQDWSRQHAMSALGDLGLQSSIGSLPGNRTTLTLACQSADFGDSQIEQLIAQIETLKLSQDLGLSQGMELIRLDLTKSKVTNEGERTLRRALPNVKILR